MASTLLLLQCVAVVVMQLLPIGIMTLLGNKLRESGWALYPKFLGAATVTLLVATGFAGSAPYSALPEPLSRLLAITCGVFTLLSFTLIVIYAVLAAERSESIDAG